MVVLVWPQTKSILQNFLNFSSIANIFVLNTSIDFDAAVVAVFLHSVSFFNSIDSLSSQLFGFQLLFATYDFLP